MVKVSELIETVKELGRTYPGTIRGCIYFGPDGDPCCIIGTALHRHGITWKDLAALDYTGNDTINTSVHVRDLLEHYADELGIEVDVTPEEVEALWRVQIRQDERYPWGRAIEVLSEARSYA